MVHKRRYNTPLRGGDKFWMELYFLLSLFWRSQKLRKTACNHGRLVEDISLILVHLTWWITGHLHQQKPLIGRLHQAWNYYCLPKSIGCSLDTFASVFLVGQKTSPKHGGSSQFLVVFITMDHGDHFRPPSGNVGPLPNGRTSWPLNGGSRTNYVTRPGMILRPRLWVIERLDSLGWEDRPDGSRIHFSGAVAWDVLDPDKMMRWWNTRCLGFWWVFWLEQVHTPDFYVLRWSIGVCC